MFDDTEVKTIQYYRLKNGDTDGQFTYSSILRVYRAEISNTKVLFANRITTTLSLRIIDMDANNLSIRIVDNAGRAVRSQNVKINPGENSFNINTGSIPSGLYYMILSSENYKRTFSFVKS